MCSIASRFEGFPSRRYPSSGRKSIFVRWLCLLAVVLLVGAAPVKSDLLQRAAQSSGAPWHFHVISRIAGTQTQVDEEGDIVVTRRCRGVVCQGTVVNAARARVSFFWYNETPILQSTALDP